MIIVLSGALAATVISLSALLSYNSWQTGRSINQLQTLAADYERAIEIEESIDNLRYFGAELSNSLSEDSYQAFVSAADDVEAVTALLPGADLKRFILASKGAIVDGSLAALDAYVLDDRATGDAIMADVRLTAVELDQRARKNFELLEQALEREQRNILNRNKRIERMAIAAAAVAILFCGAIGFLAWKRIFRPIEMIITSISSAAQNARRASDFTLSTYEENEIGLAISALNSLLVATSQAIDEAKTQAENAEKAEIRWKALFNESPDAIVLLDPETTNIIDRNPATLNLLCMKEEPGRTLSALDVHHHEAEELKRFLSDVLSTGCARCDSLSCALEDKLIPVSVVGIAVPHENEHAILLHIRDMSAQREHEQELEMARTQAVKASDAKSNFLANMSHEIRTPLNGVLGMAQGLQNAALGDKEHEMVNIILDSGKTLTSILNDILDLSKIEAGKFDIRPAETDLRESIESVHKLFAQRAEEKRIKLDLTIDENVPNIVKMDAVRVRQCISNIVSNAIKFTNSGGVFIDVVSTTNDDGDFKITITVRDTGIGMSRETCEKLFAPFMQADVSKTRGFEGTGLGLSISRRLARLMNGDVVVESAEGSGSKFSFSFVVGPLGAHRARGKTVTAKSAGFSLSGMNVLLVDDNIVNRQVVKVFLKPQDINVVEAENGKQAIELLETSGFDLVLLDIHMPVMDGIEAINYIRNSNASWAETPVIALTADAMSGDREKYIGLGMDGYLAKPIDQRKLLSLIAEIVGGERGRNRNQSAA